MAATELRRRGVPDATVARLPAYLRVLAAMADRGVRSTSSEELAAAVGVHSAKVRKDLSQLGTYGVRGVGYDVQHLSLEISRELGMTREWAVVIVGMGHLGRALAGHRGFFARGFRVAGLFDVDPAVIGERVGELTIQDLADLPGTVRGRDAIGVIATPESAAQQVADALVAAGVSSILNLAGGNLAVPDAVDVRPVEVAAELQILAFLRQRRDFDVDLERVAP
ncbi:MAG: redox-sensing transcriptional repressor Rex [Actinobacteria bacterium]|uniref:Redox-sensing transcriptional repressor Rex n=1 Tax=Nostocoides veronense TaxID=330836 RepID=A0ABN2LBV4_9MICO|nr:redox-sensing transcriptional repressor Rex [Actinomycetota bacterium]